MFSAVATGKLEAMLKFTQFTQECFRTFPIPSLAVMISYALYPSLRPGVLHQLPTGLLIALNG